MIINEDVEVIVITEAKWLPWFCQQCEESLQSHNNQYNLLRGNGCVIHYAMLLLISIPPIISYLAHANCSDSVCSKYVFWLVKLTRHILLWFQGNSFLLEHMFPHTPGMHVIRYLFAFFATTIVISLVSVQHITMAY